MSHNHPVWEAADALQMDLRAANAKLTELRSQIAALNLKPPAAFSCPICGIQFKSTAKLEEHVYTSHDGPLPAHYAHAEQIADAPDPLEEPA